MRRSASTAGEESASDRRRQEVKTFLFRLQSIFFVRKKSLELQGLEARLGTAIQQLREREEEMEGVATCLDSVNIQHYSYYCCYCCCYYFFIIIIR